MHNAIIVVVVIIFAIHSSYISSLLLLFHISSTCYALIGFLLANPILHAHPKRIHNVKSLFEADLRKINVLDRDDDDKRDDGTIDGESLSFPSEFHLFVCSFIHCMMARDESYPSLAEFLVLYKCMHFDSRRVRNTHTHNKYKTIVIEEMKFLTCGHCTRTIISTHNTTPMPAKWSE